MGMKLKSIIIGIIILMTISGGIAMSEDKDLFFKETPHTIRFHGIITFGGDVELMYSDIILGGDMTTFRKWFESLTVKELTDKWGFEIFHTQEIKKEKVSGQPHQHKD